MSKLPRVFQIVKPILLAAEISGSYGTVGDGIYSWNPNVDYRPDLWIQIRRIGGVRHETRPTQFGLPIIELTCRTNVGLPENEQMYEDVLEVLYDAVRRQTQTDAGYLSSIKETLGATQLSSEFQDSWRVQGLIKLGIRPPRSTT